MEAVKKSPFKLLQFIVEEFKISRKPVKQGKIEFGIKPSGVIDDQKKVFKLILEVFVRDINDSFDINLVAFGFFEFKNSTNKDILSNYFYVNAPALIFPYIRAYISSITALTGLKTVNLPVMNLTSLKEELKNNTTNEKVDEIS